MDRVINTLRARLVGLVLIIHAALVPLLYLGVSAIVEEGYAELFVNSVRSFSRLMADDLEAFSDQEFEQRASALLDGLVLTGQVVFTQIHDGGHELHSSIAASLPAVERADDFDFGDHGDQVYYISHPVKRGTHSAMLRLGFDEGPTLERITAAKRRVLLAVLTFTVVSLALSLWLSNVIVRPMTLLQEAAKRVAGGDVHASLQMSSSIREVKELNHHLESTLGTIGNDHREARVLQHRTDSLGNFRLIVDNQY